MVNTGCGDIPFTWFDTFERTAVSTPLFTPRLPPQATKRNEVCAEPQEGPTHKPKIPSAVAVNARFIGNLCLNFVPEGVPGILGGRRRSRPFYATSWWTKLGISFKANSSIPQCGAEAT